MANTPISSLAVYVGSSLPAGTYLEVSTPDGLSSTGFSSYRATPEQIVGASLAGYVPTSRIIGTNVLSGLNGGGNLTTDRYLSLDVDNLSEKTTPTVADAIAMNNAVDNTPVKVTPPNFYKTIAGLTHKSVPLSTDLMLVYSSADSDSRYSTIGEALGAAGSVPPGGTTGQPLIKLSSADYNTGFATLPVIGGGTGQITNTNHGILLGQGASAIAATAAMTDGQLLVGQTGADPLPKTVTGDVTISNLGVTAIGANKVTDAMLRQSAGLSVIGRSASSTGNVADITGTAYQILRVNSAGTALGFGSIDLSQSAAVGSTILGAGNGGYSGETVTVVTGSSASIAAKTVAVAVQRSAPSATSLSLPAVSAQGGLPLHIVDWSSGVTDHTITFTPDGSDTIMTAATYAIYSNSASLAGVTLYPSTTLSGWYIAP